MQLHLTRTALAGAVAGTVLALSAAPAALAGTTYVPVAPLDKPTVLAKVVSRPDTPVTPPVPAVLPNAATLPFTGSDLIIGGTILGLALAAAGTTLLVASRRRPSLAVA